MPFAQHDDDAFGGTVARLTPPDGLDALPAALRALVPVAVADAFVNPAARLDLAATAVPLPGFVAFCARLAALPVALEVAYDSFGHDDDVRLVFGIPADAPAAAAPPETDAATASGTGEDDTADLLLAGLPELEAGLPEGTLTPEMRAQMDALVGKMRRSLQPPTSPAAPVTADAFALSFDAPVVLDAPPLLGALYAAVGTIRLGPPGATAGLVAAQPADYRLDAADPDYLAVFETDAGDVLATTEDGATAVWLLAADAGETPLPAGSLPDALDAVFAALAEGRMPSAPPL